MDDIFIGIGIAAVWVVLQVFVFPRLGVST
jgi:hypothetical protein